jgi:pyruvate formate lyase activating enzyme
MKEALFYKKLKEDIVNCKACYKNCIIKEGEVGFCSVRQNINGKLYSLVYGKPISINIDPIEKKPLYHFLQKTKTLSIGTFGCNFDCDFCQNFKISKVTDINQIEKQKIVTPKEIVTIAKANNLKSISYTYTEPTIFVEYALEIMKLAKKEGLKNIWVSNGYMQKEVVKEISKYLDAINIDLKGDKEFYYSLINKTDVLKVKENIKLFNKNKVHIEITNLLIEGYNTEEKQIKEIVNFIASISKEIPVHFSRAFGYYRLDNIRPTNISFLKLAEKTAKDAGLKYVYLGNV